jgi:hypothetical protein
MQVYAFNRVISSSPGLGLMRKDALFEKDLIVARVFASESE